MKKRLMLLLIAALLALLVPHVASANSPVRRPWLIRVECENMESGTRMDVVLLRADGSTRTEENVYQPYRDETTGYAYFEYEDGETAFYLSRIAPDGTETHTETAKLTEYGLYRYDGEANRLEANGTYYSRADNCGTGVAAVACFLLLLIAPLGLTLLIEFLIALCFRIRPKKYVLIINLITNPVMNLLLFVLILFGPERHVYWIALGVLELAAVGLEYLFYTKKCRGVGKLRLFLFSLTANAVSYLIGCGALYLIT